jgi:hypothetical protein
MKVNNPQSSYYCKHIVERKELAYYENLVSVMEFMDPYFHLC